MKILYTLPDLHFGGSSNLLAQNISTLASYHTIYVVYFGPNEAMVEKFKKNGVIPMRINYSGKKDFLSAVKQLRKFILKNGIELIHTNLYLDKILVAAATAYLPIKKIAHMHEAESSRYKEFFKNKIIFKVENFLHNYIYHKTIAVSEAAKINCLKERNIDEKKVYVVYNGIKALRKVKTENPIFKINSDIILGTACRFHSIKGILRLIKLFFEIKKVQPNIKLLLIGDGDQRNEIENLVKLLNLEKEIFITGFTNDVAIYLNQLDYYVNSSFSEAMPVSVLEALSLGKPILASNVGGLKEVIIDGYNGTLVNFKDADEALKIFIETLENHRENYSFLSKNAFESFYNSYSSDIYCERLNSLYAK